MRLGKKTLLVVGDRVLIKPDNPEERTKVGLYLPQTVIDKQQVQSGKIVCTGPGIPIPDIGIVDDNEPWQTRNQKTRFIPMQAEVNDHALFLKKDAVEIKYDGDEYLVVPQASILVLMRDEMNNGIGID